MVINTSIKVNSKYKIVSKYKKHFDLRSKNSIKDYKFYVLKKKKPQSSNCAMNT